MMVIMHKCNVQTAVHTAELEWSVTVSECLGVAVQQQIFRLLVAARAEATTATAETISCNIKAVLQATAVSAVLHAHSQR